MTTITPSRIPERRRSWRGFTLAEIMIGASLGAFLLAAVLSTFLFMGRSGANLQNYSDMEAQARKALEMFAEDVRQASAITWNSSTEIDLVVNSATVRYLYDSGTSTFYRRTSSGTTALITGITSGTFFFTAYDVTGDELDLVTASDLSAASSSTKQLQISLKASRSSTTVTDATNTVLSARFILRNKVVTA